MISLAGTEVLVTQLQAPLVVAHNVSEDKAATRKEEAIWPASLSEQKLWRKPGRIR